MFRKWQEVKFDLNIGLAKRKDEKGEEAGLVGTRCKARLPCRVGPSVGCRAGRRGAAPINKKRARPRSVSRWGCWLHFSASHS